MMSGHRVRIVPWKKVEDLGPTSLFLFYCGRFQLHSTSAAQGGSEYLYLPIVSDRMEINAVMEVQVQFMDSLCFG